MTSRVERNAQEATELSANTRIGRVRSNQVGCEEIFFIPNPGLGLRAHRDRL
jgi:hypothetical protein